MVNFNIFHVIEFLWIEEEDEVYGEKAEGNGRKA